MHHDFMIWMKGFSPTFFVPISFSFYELNFFVCLAPVYRISRAELNFWIYFLKSMTTLVVGQHFLFANQKWVSSLFLNRHFLLLVLHSCARNGSFGEEVSDISMLSRSHALEQNFN